MQRLKWCSIKPCFEAKGAKVYITGQPVLHNHENLRHPCSARWRSSPRMVNLKTWIASVSPRWKVDNSLSQGSWLMLSAYFNSSQFGSSPIREGEKANGQTQTLFDYLCSVGCSFYWDLTIKSFKEHEESEPSMPRCRVLRCFSRVAWQCKF